jgi:hypothetical protein
MNSFDREISNQRQAGGERRKPTGNQRRPRRHLEDFAAHILQPRAEPGHEIRRRLDPWQIPNDK